MQKLMLRLKEIYANNNTFFLTWVACLVLIYVSFNAPSPKTQVLYQLNFYILVGYFNIFLILSAFFLLRICFKRMMKQPILEFFLIYIDISLKTAFFIQVLRGFIGGIGDDVYSLFLQNPTNFTLAIVSACIVVLCALLMIINRSKLKEFKNTNLFQNGNEPSIEVTEKAYKHASAHEAGHAMLYACFEQLPQEAYVKINPKNPLAETSTDFLGYTLRLQEDPIVTTLCFAQWEMLSFLAGQMAEKIILGELTLGSTTDYQHWLVLSKQYLSNQTVSLFFPNPESRFEFERNVTIQDNLLKQHKSMVHKFFMANSAQLHSLYDFLREEGEANNKTLEPFFKNIVFPEGFPRIKAIQTKEQKE